MHPLDINSCLLFLAQVDSCQLDICARLVRCLPSRLREIGLLHCVLKTLIITVVKAAAFTADLVGSASG